MSTRQAAPTIFDRTLLRHRRDRAAPGFGGCGFLVDEVAARLLERLSEVKRQFPLAVDLGCHTGALARGLLDMPGSQTVIAADLAPAFAATARQTESRLLAVAADEEALPFAPQSLDLVASCLSLHWVNDLPGTLLQIRNALKPDGFFIAALPGGESLRELRAALLEAESELSGGVSPRVSPFLFLEDAAALLLRAGFALPVADSETITVSYRDALALMRDLQAMGESAAHHARPHRPPPRALLARAAALYQQRHAEADGRIPARFDIIFLAGWSPAPTQPQPLAPGSARISLSEALR